jgi:hypothetical protein
MSARALVVRAGLTLALVGSLIGFASMPAAQAACSPTLSSVPSAPSGFTVRDLRAVASAGVDNLFAAGVDRKSDGTARGTVARFNGTKWTVTQLTGSMVSGTPLATAEVSELDGITVLSSKNVWAVGYYSPQAFGDQAHSTARPFAMHFDGTKWKFFAVPPAVAGDGGFLNGVAALAPNDIYAVGAAVHFYTFPFDFDHDLMVSHWNGTKWSSEKLADVVAATGNPPRERDQLNAITAVPGKSMLVAVGVDSGKAFVAKFNNGSWASKALPHATGSTNDELKGVAAVNATNVWGVGNNSGGGFSAHFNGTKWTVANVLPNVTLNAITVVTAQKIYAVGLDFRSGPPYGELVLKNTGGSTWSVVHAPLLFKSTDPDVRARNVLKGVAPNGTGAMAVGEADTNSVEVGLAVELC